MKIGVLTYFWAHNHGTFLQAYCTCKWLQKKHPDARVELINIKVRNVEFKIGKRRLINPVKLIRDRKGFYKYKAEQDRCFSLSAPEIISFSYSKLTEYIARQKYDLIAVGADTVLEVLPQHKELNEVPIYWLPPEIECKKVILSASAGATTASILTDHQLEHMERSIRDFDVIGVRDRNAYDLISDIGISSDKIQIVPDPTFPLQIDYGPVDKYIRQNGLDFSTPSVAINLPEKHPLCQKLVQHYTAAGFNIVMLNNCIKRKYCIPPMTALEWAGIHKYFTLEITDRFHGTVFSLKNLTPVVSVDWESRKRTASGLSKIFSMQKVFGNEKTNYVNAVALNDYQKVLELTDNAIENHDKDKIQIKLDDLASQYTKVIDNI